MIIKCRHCGREFDKPSHRNQHEKDVHPKPLPKVRSTRKTVAVAAKEEGDQL